MNIWTGYPLAEDFSFDEFVPPVKSEISDVDQLEIDGKVTEDDGVLISEKAQDGLNYALKELLNEDGDGVKSIAVSSGFAVISVATQSYKTYENRTATLLSKRQAYSIAMAQAQKQLVNDFEGIENACEKSFDSNLKTFDTGKQETVANVSTTGKETCKERVEGVLAGYVTYFVKDDVANKSVVVSLASSTKTRNSIKKVGGAVVQTDDTSKAWESIIAEITNGLVPPLGARLITNPITGENVVIGFGSAIVRKHKDASVSRKLKKTAKKQAQMRANNALVSFLNGDKVYWEGGFDESQSEESKDFEMALPPNSKDISVTPKQEAENTKIYDETQSSFLNVMKDSDIYKITTQGKLPPGVKPKSFIDKEGDWAIAISVYSSSMTAQAEKSGRENRSATGKLDSYQKGSQNHSESVYEKSGTKKLLMKGGLDDEAENPAGPSGTVTNDSDL